MGKKGFIILGLVILLLCGGVIGFFHVYPAIQFQYYYIKLLSADLTEREEAVRQFLTLGPECIRRLEKAALEKSDSCSPGAAVVLAKSPVFDFRDCAPSWTISFASAASGEWARDRIDKKYLSDLGAYLFKIRPSGLNRIYYDALFGCRYDPPVKKDINEDFGAMLGCMQAPDGRWLSEDGTPEGDLLVSGLALYSLLWEGNTKTAGPYKRNVWMGFDFLTKQMNVSNGKFSDDTISNAVCTLAFADFYAVTHDNQSGEITKIIAANLALRILPDGGFPAKAGGTDSDVLATCWSVLALKAANSGGINMLDKEISESARKYAENWFINNKDFKKAAALGISSVFCGAKRSEWYLKSATEAVVQHLPTLENGFDAEYVYLGNFFMFQMGGTDWKKWNDSYKKCLSEYLEWNSKTDGSKPLRGMDEKSRKYGRCFTIALSWLAVKTYYMYRRIYR
jgi:hypothetical protein